MLVVACGREAPRPSADSVTLVPVTPSAAASPLTSVSGKQVCPPTGLWSACAVFERLDRAGLAPRLDSGSVTEPPLTPTGSLLQVGTSALELYVYPDEPSRQRDQARLVAANYVAYAAPMPMRPLPTLIPSVNLIAILHSRNEHQRERVADAITAGPPQPPIP